MAAWWKGVCLARTFLYELLTCRIFFIEESGKCKQKLLWLFQHLFSLVPLSKLLATCVSALTVLSTSQWLSITCTVLRRLLGYSWNSLEWVTNDKLNKRNVTSVVIAKYVVIIFQRGRTLPFSRIILPLLQLCISEHFVQFHINGRTRCRHKKANFFVGSLVIFWSLRKVA